MTDALKPCPFCGSADLYATSNGHESHSVGCNFCGTEGPAAPTDSTARDVWNDRAALAQPAASVELAQPEGEDWALLLATQESLREHMAEIHRLRAEVAVLRDANDRWRKLRPTVSGEPVAYWISKAEQFSIAKQGERPFAKAWQPLYAAPQPAQARVPLTDVELTQIELRLRIYCDYDKYDLSLHDFARAIEAAHGIKENNSGQS